MGKIKSLFNNVAFAIFVTLIWCVTVAWAADTKVSALTELAATPADSDELYINDGGTSKKIQYSNLVGGLQAEPAEGAFEDGDKTRLDALFDQETSSGGTTPSITVTNGSVFTHTVATGETTFTFASPEASGSVSKFTLVLTNGGSQTVNWPASVDWPSGVVPTLTTSGVDILTFLTVDGGTTWYGFYPGIDIK